jgi:hypothetical protein
MTASKVVIALMAGAFVAVFAAQAVAQDSPQRDAAISRCVRQAHLQYPDDTVDHNNNRTFAYKACMTNAGFNP